MGASLRVRAPAHYARVLNPTSIYSEKRSGNEALHKLTLKNAGSEPANAPCIGKHGLKHPQIPAIATSYVVVWLSGSIKRPTRGAEPLWNTGLAHVLTPRTTFSSFLERIWLWRPR